MQIEFMNWINRLFPFFSNKQQAHDTVDRAAIDNLSIKQARTCALCILNDTKFFTVEKIKDSYPHPVPAAYANLFSPPVSYSAIFQDLIIDYLGRPEWAADRILEPKVILGALGEAGYLICDSEVGHEISVFDTPLVQECDKYLSLYHLILCELSEIEPVYVTELLRRLR